MLRSYIQAALRYAKHNILSDTKSYYGEIPAFQGVYSNAKTLETCRKPLQEVLEEWILFRVSKHLPLPIVDGIELKIRMIV
ncbi:MAG: type II toxin-antitoxin system HicB family antitoxin [Sulfuricaulis sp.]|uniref:type II toxin-antitoxin system HicB family antitoxin n=1 Tax=Sulfuricaulis sp. TaxID=2003553 RepID=UPI0025FDC6A6|nr:type II toxin-antitoxin system HicB family antitoxin [Sulfuricaulis sp.]MCR4348163.1 type II toxin-antitoxin system HicB family antitoxin [Sulfuricaulis sp.]